MPHRGARVRGLLATVVPAGLLLVLLAGCTAEGEDGPGGTTPVAADAEIPELGACRVLTPEIVAQPSDSSPVVDCVEPHTAETFAVGTLPDELHDAAYDDPALGRFAYAECGEKFRGFLGADESLVMRSLVTWAWFRPSEAAWDSGARWYRCDAVGGGEASTEYVDLPETAEGLLRGRPDDRWTVCADGPSVAEGERVACSEPHTWRAISTIRIGEADEEWPGDRIVEVTSRDFCSSSVGALLGYPTDYEFGWTAFGEGQWEAGNRRSICWARTDS